MYKQVSLLLLLFIALQSHAQNIYTALHLNENREFKAGKPAQITELNTFYNSSGKQVDKNIKTFDNSGMLLKEERYNQNGDRTAVLTYKNDTARKLKLERTMEQQTAIGLTIETAIYSYDEKGFLIRTTDVDINRNPFHVTETKNNEKGHPVELQLSNGNGYCYGRETAEYFYDKNVLTTTVYSCDGRQLSTSTMKISFDAAGVDDKSIYNDHGDLISYTSQNFNGTEKLLEYEYVYDDKGNCIDEKIYEVTLKANGKKKRKLERHFVKIITYYPS